MRTPVFDAHCHIFNVYYLLDELANILWDLIRDKYPLKECVKKSDAKTKHEKIKSAKLLINWLFEIIDSFFDSDEENMNLLIDKGSNAWGISENDMCIIPLMMDIFYMFAYNLDQIDDIGELNIGSENSIENHSLLEDELNDCLPKEALVDKGHKKHRRKREWIKRIIEELKNRRYENGDVDWSWGFENQVEILKHLVQKHSGKLYPFFAVDPRRPGIVEYIRKSGIISKKGPFYGIKIYPYLGCHPDCKALTPIYDFCSEMNIPITTHTAVSGFPPEKLCPNVNPDFGNPQNYESIIKRYNGKLKLNFAHFGHGNENWGKSIVDLMSRYENVYSDLSCYTEFSDLKEFVKKIWINDIVKKRTMFGSDFDVMYFTNPGDVDINEYYKSFKKLFSEEELNYMASDLPLKFLGL